VPPDPALALPKDGLLQKLSRLDKERENWRSDAVRRVHNLEEKHNDITAKRLETEAYMSQLQKQLNEVPRPLPVVCL